MSYLKTVIFSDEMDKIQVMNIIQVYEKFPTREHCLSHLEKLRWKGRPECPYCGSSNFTARQNVRRYHCNRCNTKYSVTVKTTFHKTHVDLQKWFLAIYLLIYIRENISARQLAKKLEVDKNTAWLMTARIDRAMAIHEERDLLVRIFEYD